MVQSLLSTSQVSAEAAGTSAVSAMATSSAAGISLCMLEASCPETGQEAQPRGWRCPLGINRFRGRSSEGHAARGGAERGDLDVARRGGLGGGAARDGGHGGAHALGADDADV